MKINKIKTAPEKILTHFLTYTFIIFPGTKTQKIVDYCLLGT